MPELDPVLARSAIEEVVRRAREAGLSGAIEVFGGAAIALLYPDDPAVRVTRDVDAAYVPNPELQRIIDEVGVERNLGQDWLNDRGVSFLPEGRARKTNGDFRWEVTDIGRLIATKMAAGRPHDLIDLAIIARREGIAEAQDLVGRAFAEYGDDSVVLGSDRDHALLFARSVIALAERQARSESPGER